MDPEQELAALFERHATLGQLPGWAIRADILSLDRSLRVFTGNHRELAEHLEANAHVVQLANRDDREALDTYLDEVDRLLHNYLAAAVSLKEHSVRIRDRRLPPAAGDDLAADYEAHADATFNSPLARFVRLLRNYSQHRRPPITSGRFKYATGKGFDSNAVLPAKELLSWNRWGGLAKQFIEDAGEEIVLSEVVTSYTEAVRQFQAWFRKALLWRHREAIRQLQREKEDIAQAYSKLTGEPIRRRDTPDPTR